MLDYSELFRLTEDFYVRESYEYTCTVVNKNALFDALYVIFNSDFC